MMRLDNGFTERVERHHGNPNNSDELGLILDPLSDVQVVVAEPQPTFFMKIAGILSSNVSATAVAHLGNGPGLHICAGASGVGALAGVPIF